MEKRARFLWITLSVFWILSCALVLHRATIAELRGPAPAAAAVARAPASAEARHSSSNIVVVVMPSPPMVSEPLTRIDRLETIHETWGRDLAGVDHNSVVFVVDESDASTAAAASGTWGLLGTSPLSTDERHLRHARQLQDQEDTTSRRKLARNQEDTNTFRVIVVPDAITQGGKDGDARLRYVLAMVSGAHDPSFLFFCNEHTFVIAENLLCYVNGLDASEPLYLGNRFRKESSQKDEGVKGKPLLNSGAAGFILSRASLTLLNRAWGGGEGGGSVGHLWRDGDDAEEDAEAAGGARAAAESEGGESGFSLVSAPPPECVATSEYERGNPGITLARCLDHVGVRAQDTSDTKGGQRFNAYGPVRLAQGKIDQWYKDVHPTDPGMWRAGPDCCSADTVSFHYVGPAEARAMHRILHHRDTYLTEGFDAALSLWPSSPRDLGPYAARPLAGDGTFDLLLNKIQVCPVSA